MIYSRAELHNIAEIVPLADNSGVELCRLPNTLRMQLHPIAQQTARLSSGVEIRFHMKSDKVRIRIQVLNSDEQTSHHSVAQVYFGSVQAGLPHILEIPFAEIEIERPAERSLLQIVAAQKGHPFDSELVRVILPFECRIALLGIDGEIEPPQRESFPDRRILIYGSSITHGASAIRPTATYAMRAAELLNMDLLNLGVAGGAMADAVMADYIADRSDWDVAVLELGINMIWDVQNARPGSPEDFRKAVDYFIPRIAESRPHQLIFCTDMFYFKGDLGNDPIGQQFRSTVAETVKRMDLPHVRYMPGTALLKQPDLLTADFIHPSEEGHLQISDRLVAWIKSCLSAGER